MSGEYEIFFGAEADNWVQEARFVVPIPVELKRFALGFPKVTKRAPDDKGVRNLAEPGLSQLALTLDSLELERPGADPVPLLDGPVEGEAMAVKPEDGSGGVIIPRKRMATSGDVVLARFSCPAACFVGLVQMRVYARPLSLEDLEQLGWSE